MNTEELILEVDKLRPWYHSLKLPASDGFVTTPGEDAYCSTWNIIRKAREQIDYKGKKVLDLATFDGMWAFEAEKLGAEFVVATDCNWEAIKRFTFAHKMLDSKVTYLANVPVQDLVRRLDVYMKGSGVRWKRHEDVGEPLPLTSDPKFDIVQHLGLFYHLIDPMLSLLQTRSVMKDGGKLLLETAYWPSDGEMDSFMAFNHPARVARVYDDITTWWCPTIRCIGEVLHSCCFKTVEGSRNTWRDDHTGRIALVAEAVPYDQVDPRLMRELRNTYRTPGLVE